jgi:hypothetical protein
MVVVGAGGAARALAFGAASRGALVVVANRSMGRAEELAAACGPSARAVALESIGALPCLAKAVCLLACLPACACLLAGLCRLLGAAMRPISQLMTGMRRGLHLPHFHRTVPPCVLSCKSWVR